MLPLHSRIAPTPSGYLHLGNLYSFVLTWLLVRVSKGTLRLRIDDLDNERFREAYLQDIFEALHWVGLDYDAGATHTAQLLSQESQHLRLTLYEAALAQLREKNLLYACVCSRKQIQVVQEQNQLVNHSQIYPQTCRLLALPFDLATTHTLRVALPTKTVLSFQEFSWQQGNSTTQEVVVNDTIGDFVVQQKNGKPAYQIASLIDDQLYGINLVVRGRDLLPSTTAQLFLATQLNLPNFGNTLFLHHPLLLDSQGKKMSKSQASTALKDLRQQGVEVKAIMAMIAKELDLPLAHKICNLQEMLDAFAKKSATMR
jgi:glutamyl/glutaminyl-tRNA synthetase